MIKSPTGNDLPLNHNNNGKKYRVRQHYAHFPCKTIKALGWQPKAFFQCIGQKNDQNRTKFFSGERILKSLSEPNMIPLTRLEQK